MLQDDYFLFVYTAMYLNAIETFILKLFAHICSAVMGPVCTGERVSDKNADLH